MDAVVCFGLFAFFALFTLCTVRERIDRVWWVHLCTWHGVAWRGISRMVDTLRHDLSSYLHYEHGIG
jgi:hypothetical protein